MQKAEGDAHFRSGDFVQAEKCYHSALLESDSPHTLHLNIALCLFHQGRFTDCVTSCSAALALKPDYTKALYRRALAHERLCEFSAALADFQTLKNEPSLHQAVEDAIRRCIRCARQGESAIHNVVAALDALPRAKTDSSVFLEIGKGLTSLYGSDRRQMVKTAILGLRKASESHVLQEFADFLLAMTRTGIQLEVENIADLTELCELTRQEHAEKMIPLVCQMYSSREAEQISKALQLFCALLQQGVVLPSLHGISCVSEKSLMSADQVACVLSAMRDTPHTVDIYCKTVLVQCLNRWKAVLPAALKTVAIQIPITTFGDCLLLWGLSVVDPPSLLTFLSPESLAQSVEACLSSSEAPQTALCLDLLRNTLNCTNYRSSTESVLALAQRHRSKCTQDSDLEARFQALLTALQVIDGKKNLCDVQRLARLLPSEAALDALCLLAYQSKYKQRIVEALQKVEMPEASLFSVVALLRNLSLSNLDKALLAPPSDYSESEKQQARDLLAAAEQTSPDSEEESGLSKQLLLTVPLLTSTLKAYQKSRKAASGALKKAWLELVFSLAETKEARGLLISFDVLTDVLSSERRELAGHTAARLLLTTNPALLPLTQLQDAAPLIHSVLKSARHELVDFECTLALVNLSGFHSDLRDQLALLQAHRSALDLLSSENDLIRRTALELLCNLSAAEPLQREIERKKNNDLLQVICALVDSSEEYTAFLAVGALANIVHIEWVRDAVRAVRGKVEALVRKYTSEEWRRRLVVLTETLGD